MPTTTREIHLASRPSGWPTPDNFRTVEVTLPDPGPGQVLVRNTVLSVDPYMRGRMLRRTATAVLPAVGFVDERSTADNAH
jgi:NADPH-dependent curcumin reductase CurA